MKAKGNIRISPYVGSVRVGRPSTVKSGELASWRHRNRASIAQTASHFCVSVATVKRHCLAAKLLSLEAKRVAVLAAQVRRAEYEGEDAAYAKLSEAGRGWHRILK